MLLQILQKEGPSFPPLAAGGPLACGHLAMSLPPPSCTHLLSTMSVQISLSHFSYKDTSHEISGPPSILN